MNDFLDFLGEKKQPEWRVSFKKQKMNGVSFTEDPVTVKAPDFRGAVIKAAKKLGLDDKSKALMLKTKDVEKQE